MTTFWQNTIVTAALRLMETSIVVSLLTFLTTLSGALTATGGWANYDWRQALVSLGLGIAAGIVNGLITALNLVNQANKGTP